MIVLLRQVDDPDGVNDLAILQAERVLDAAEVLEVVARDEDLLREALVAVLEAVAACIAVPDLEEEHAAVAPR